MGFPYPYPLGLPRGSVRATTTLMIAVNLILLSLDEAKIALAETLSVAAAVSISFYFGGRMRATQITPRDTIDDVSDRIATSERAWGLPAGSIRIIIIILFAGTLYYLQTEDGAIPDHLLEIINIIGGFILGRGFNKIKHGIFGKERGRTISLIDHLKAIGLITMAILTMYFTLVTVPSFAKTWIFIFNITIGFYFGERN